MKPRNDALALLRAIFDLADADVRADADLLARLTGQPATRVQDLLGWLEHRGLLQRGALALTMAGLVAASAIAPSEPVPMTAAPARTPARRAA